MSSDCQALQDLMERYQDGELSKRKRSRVDQHLRECAGCRQTLELLKLQGELLRQNIEEAVNLADFSGFEERVLSKIADERPLPAMERVLLWIRELAYQHRAVWISSLATAAVLLAVLIPLSLNWGQPDVLPGASQTASVDNEAIIDSMEYAGERSMIFTVSKNNTTVIWLYDIDQAGSKKDRKDEL
jgi:predicted anti-sigma-YlaC factor YlaD